MILIVMIFIVTGAFIFIIASSMPSGRRTDTADTNSSEHSEITSADTDENFFTDSSVPSKTVFAVYGVDQGCNNSSIF